MLLVLNSVCQTVVWGLHVFCNVNSWVLQTLSRCLEKLHYPINDRTSNSYFCLNGCSLDRYWNRKEPRIQKVWKPFVHTSGYNYFTSLVTEILVCTCRWLLIRCCRVNFIALKNAVKENYKARYLEDLITYGNHIFPYCSFDYFLL